MEPLETDLPATSIREMPPASVRLIVADSSPLIVQGLIKIVDEDRNAEVAASATSFQQLQKAMADVPVEVVIIGWGLIRGNPTEAHALIEANSSGARAIVLIESESMHERRFALEIGARGILSTRCTAHEVRKAVRKVHRGGLSIEQTDAVALLEQTLSPDTAEYRKGERLTHREREVALLVCQGLTNKQISAELSISETTVWHHLTSVFGKLEVSGRVGLVNYAHRHLLAAVDRSPGPLPRKRAGQWSVIETHSGKRDVYRRAKIVGSR